MEWKFRDEIFDEEKAQKAIDDGYMGFVYIVKNTLNGKKYIGKKKLMITRRLPPLKGMKRKRVVRKQSDWQTYCGSSEEVKTLVEEHGIDVFEREIIHLCKSPGELTYKETKEIFDRNALLREDFYNAFVGCKINASHLKSMLP